MINFIRSQLEALQRVVSGVVSFIGSLWSRIYKYVASVVKPILVQIQRVGQNLYNTILSVIFKYVGSIYKRITSVFNEARHFAITLLAKAVTTAKNFAKAIVQGARDLANRAIALIIEARRFLGGQINAIVSDVVSIYRWIRDRGDAVFNIVRDWLKVFTPANLSRFVYLVVNLFPSIFNFFKDPVAHLTLWLETFLLDMLFWLLAYELGARKSTLPNKPKRYG